MLDHQTNHILEMDQLAKERVRNLLRHGASMLRIKAQGARDYAEHQRTLVNARFKALVAYETNIEGYLIMSKATTEGWKPSSYQEFDSIHSALGQRYGRAKQLLDTIRSDDIESILSIVEELTHYTNKTTEIVREIKTKLDSATYERIRKVAYEKLKDTYI